MSTAIVAAIVSRKTPRGEMCQRTAGDALRTASGECLLGLFGWDNGIPQSGFALDRKPLSAPNDCQHGAGPAPWQVFLEGWEGNGSALVVFAHRHFPREVSLRPAQEIVRRMCAWRDSDMATGAEHG